MTALSKDIVRAEQVRSIYTNTGPGMVATWLAVTILTLGLIYIDAVVRSRALIFLAIMFGQTAARLILIRLYRASSVLRSNWKPWAWWFTVGTLVGGLCIGAGTIWMIPEQRVELQLLALLLIFACTSGAVSAFAAFLPAFYVFFTAVSIVPATWLFSRGDALHVLIGILYLIWFIAVAEQARRSSIAFESMIRLRLENEDLVVSLRKEKSAAEEANAAKSRFLAAASHDLRQPVHALSLFVEAARSHPMSDAIRGLLDHIDASVRAMGQLFGGLLDISRLDAGVVEVNRAAFAIRPLIERVAREFEAQARAKGLEIRVHASNAVIESDPILLERTLRNIIANAVTYTDRGTVLIGCRRGKSLRVQVWDTGRGIPDNERQSIFQEFYQIGNAERDRNKGVGLGLAIVKRLLSLLGHPLELRSVFGKGTCFSIELPYATGSATHIAATDESASLVSRGSGLILVLDDEVTIQVGMKSLLESWGYSVLTAGNCDEMLSTIATHPEAPQLIICDYRLREQERGTDAIERLRSEYNDDEIPGMLVTGDTAPDRLKEAQDSGFLLLHKPVPNSRLRAAITHLIGA